MHAGDDCCPADQDCNCGRCSAPLPPGQVVACAAESQGKTCCDEPSSVAGGEDSTAMEPEEEAAPEAGPPAKPASGGGTVSHLGSWLNFWAQQG